MDYLVYADIPEDPENLVLVHRTRGHVKAGKLAVDLVRYGVVTRSNVERRISWQGPMSPSRTGRALHAAVEAHRAGVA